MDNQYQQPTEDINSNNEQKPQETPKSKGYLVIALFVLAILIVGGSIVSYFFLVKSSGNIQTNVVNKQEQKDEEDESNNFETAEMVGNDEGAQEILNALINHISVSKRFSHSYFNNKSVGDINRSLLGTVFLEGIYYRCDKNADDLPEGLSEDECVVGYLSSLSDYSDFFEIQEIKKDLVIHFDDKQAVVSYFVDFTENHWEYMGITQENAQAVKESGFGVQAIFFFYLIKDNDKWLVAFNNIRSVALDLVALGIPHNDEDKDQDGLVDNIENCELQKQIKIPCEYETETDNPDTDGDGWWDGIEIFVFGTSPIVRDETLQGLYVDGVYSEVNTPEELTKEYPKRESECDGLFSNYDWLLTEHPCTSEDSCRISVPPEVSDESPGYNEQNDACLFAYAVFYAESEDTFYHIIDLFKKEMFWSTDPNYYSGSVEADPKQFWLDKIESLQTKFN